MFDIINKLKKGLGYEDKIFAHNFAISNKKGSTGFLIIQIKETHTLQIIVKEKANLLRLKQKLWTI